MAEKTEKKTGTKRTSSRTRKTTSTKTSRTSKAVQQQAQTDMLEKQAAAQIQLAVDEAQDAVRQQNDSFILYISIILNVIVLGIVILIGTFVWQGIQDEKQDVQADITRLEKYIDTQAQDLTALEDALAAIIPGFEVQNTAVTITAPTPNERWLGNPNAEVVWVMYSDYDCPFCQNMWSNLRQVQQSEDIAIVFRHLPLTSLHPNAQRVAQASECVATLEGNQAFFEFTDAYKLNRSIDASFATISDFVSDQATFNRCMQSDLTAEKVDRDRNEAQQNGMTGTPANVLYNRSTNQTQLVRGAVPYAQIIEEIQSFGR